MGLLLESSRKLDGAQPHGYSDDGSVQEECSFAVPAGGAVINSHLNAGLIWSL